MCFGRGVRRRSRWAATAGALAAACLPPSSTVAAQPSRDAAWDAVAAGVERVATYERGATGTAGSWWAVVDARGIVRLGAGGRRARGTDRAATTDDRLRVGAVTQTVTALAVLRLVARGQLDLDAPLAANVRRALPTGANVTLRQLLSHRAGLVQESPVGHSFDTTVVSLERAVASMRTTRMLASPGANVAYSNAGVAVAARALEVAAGIAYDAVAERELFGPLAMRSSDFAERPGDAETIGEGWTIAGPPEPASHALLGLRPAVGLRTTVRDLARMLLALVRGGRDTAGAAWLDPTALAQMTMPSGGVELGLRAIVDGTGRRLEQSGVVPGFAAHLIIDPGDSVGVVVVLNNSAGAAAVERIAREALRLARDAHAGHAVVAGVIGGEPGNGAASAAVVIAGRPALPSAAIASLLGLYENGLMALLIGERDGRVWLTTPDRWIADAALAGDTLRTTVGPHGRGETFVAERDMRGRVVAVHAWGLRLVRRRLGPESGNQLRVSPVRPLAALRREALAAAPPVETGRDAPVELVELSRLDSTIRLEVRYATSNNLYGAPFYTQARAFLQRPAAEALARVSAALRPLGVGLLVHDGYRPWYVTRMFWDAAAPSVKPFVADPGKGSKHNRGAAVDLALYDLASGATVPMPSTYDETTLRAYPDWPGGTSRERWARDLLRAAMEREGFTVYDYEWWHFDYAGWARWPLLNTPFERLGAAR